MGGIRELEDAAEFREALTDAGDKFCVVDFFATWCGPCKAIAPRLEAMATNNPDVAFFKVDVDANEEVAHFYKIRSMPTFGIFRHGQQLNSFSGADENGIWQALSQARSTAYDIMASGTSVVAHGLQAESAQARNGTAGTVLGYSWSNGRYTVQFGDGKSLALKPRNLLLRCSCILPDGRAARIIGPAADVGGYVVVVQDSDGGGGGSSSSSSSGGGCCGGGGGGGCHGSAAESKSTCGGQQKPEAQQLQVSAADVTLAVGSVCYVDGLVGAAHLNGSYGKIEGQEGERYVVQVKTNERVKLKRANVFAGRLV